MLIFAQLADQKQAADMPDLSPIASKLKRAAGLRTLALVPNTTATLPDEWDEDEDGGWEPPMVDGGDGQDIGTFFQKHSRAKACGFPEEGLLLLRRMMAAQGVMHQELQRAVAAHPFLSEVWDKHDETAAAAQSQQDQDRSVECNNIQFSPRTSSEHRRATRQPSPG